VDYEEYPEDFYAEHPNAMLGGMYDDDPSPYEGTYSEE